MALPQRNVVGCVGLFVVPVAAAIVIAHWPGRHGASLAAAPSPSSANTPSGTAEPAYLAPLKSKVHDVVSFIGENCMECHNAADHAGDVNLEAFKSASLMRKQRNQWEKIMVLVSGGAMPPPEAEKKPEKIARDQFVNAAKMILNYVDPARPDPGNVTIRRLNRNEYDNSIYDLLGINFSPSAEFPPDDVSGGYDNNGDGLILSPILMERYLAAAEATLESVLPEQGYWPLVTKADNQWNLPPGSFRQTADGRTGIKHVPAGGRLWIRQAIRTEGEYKFRSFAYWHKGDGLSVPKLTLEVHAEGADGAGERLMSASFDVDVIGYEGSIFYESPPVHLKPGNYYFSIVRTLRDGETAPPPLQVLQGKDEPPGLYSRWGEITGPFTTDVSLMAHKAGQKPRDAAREVIERFATRAYRRPATKDEVEALLSFYDQSPGIDKVTENFTPTSPEGLIWYQAVRPALLAVLVSPKFLYRAEEDNKPNDAGPHPITDYQLASRLSYFLWSGPPDDQLLALAAKDDLHNHIEEQVRRMLKDRKADALTANFAEQWLHLRMLKKVTPDNQKFPEYYHPVTVGRGDTAKTYTLPDAMRVETLTFFNHVVTEDKSILDLIDGNYTYLNAPLAQLYGITDTKGNMTGEENPVPGGQPIPVNDYVKVDLQNKLRGGVLTQASVLTITSNPGRTSPVKRGKFVMEQFLGESPPPPPPNVPALDDHKELTGNLRQRMEQHRADPRCASCHVEMDQIGFGFENFNAIGRWRTKDDDADIDASGVLPGGEKFQGAAELKEVLKGKSQQFAGCFTEQLMTYALGRQMQFYDRPAVDKIVAAAAADDYRFSRIIVEICKSDPFRLRRGKEQTDE